MVKSCSPLLGYVGSKDIGTFGVDISDFFDQNTTKYCEAFAGGAGIWFSMDEETRNRYEHQILNDINIDLACFYKSFTMSETSGFIKTNIDMVEKKDDIAEAKKIFEQAKHNLLGRGPYDLSRLSLDKMVSSGRNAFINISQSYNHGGKSYCPRLTAEQYQRRCDEAINTAMSKLSSKTEVFCEDATELLGKHNLLTDPRWQLYLDPPYLGINRLTPNSKNYFCEMMSISRHIELLNKIANASSAVVLSGYRPQNIDIPCLYDAFLSDNWYCYLIKRRYISCPIVKQGQERQLADEYIWTNRPYSGSQKYRDYKEHLSMDEYWDKIRELGKKYRLPYKFMLEYNIAYERIYGDILIDPPILEIQRITEKTAG